jgi:hypothetical protein
MPELGPYTIFDDLATRRRTGQSVDYWTVYFFDSWTAGRGAQTSMAGMVMSITVDCARNRYRVNATYALLPTGMAVPIGEGSGQFQAPDPNAPGDAVELRTACEWRPPPARLTFSTLMEAALFAREQRATPI